jgi:DNA (cytosine-5)-methyltransferase 1
MREYFEEYTKKDIKTRHSEISKLTHEQEMDRNKDKTFHFIDLFAGIGGIRKSFESVGGGCVFSSEIDIHAQHTYYTNYGVVPYGDISNIDLNAIPEHDILCGGFPCQPFSNIGKREGFSHPTQGTMFNEILKIIDSKLTRVIFLENVPGILNHDKGNTLKIILSELSDRGYTCHYTILNSSDFGVPQNRKRFYLVCFLDDVSFNFPKPPMNHVDIGDYIESDIDGYTISKHLQKSYLFKKDDGKPQIVDTSSKGSIKTMVSSYHKVQRLTGTFVRGGETGLRLLSVNECKSIMGFPKDFHFPVSRTQMYRQIGNSVVINVISKIANEIIESIS